MPASQLPESLSVDGFVEFLSMEMERLRSEHERPGWTTWALVGALAAVVWLLLDVLGPPGLHWQGAALAFFLLSLVVDSGRAIHAILSPEHDDKAMHQNRFTLYSKELGDSRTTYLLVMAKVGTFCYLAWTLQDLGLHQLHKAAFIGFYLAVFLLEGIVLFLSFLGIPKPLSSHTFGRPFMAMLYVIIVGVPASTVLVVIAHMVEAGAFPAIAEWRVGALALGLLFALSRLSQGSKEMITHATLADIRRRLVLGHIDLQVAVRQADIALCGMKLDDVVKNELREAMHVIAEAAQEVRKAQAFIDASSAMLEKGEEGKENAVVILCSVNSCLEHSKLLVDGLGEHAHKLWKKMGLAMRVAKDRPPEADQIHKNVNDLLSDLIEDYKRTVGRLNELEARLAQSRTL